MRVRPLMFVAGLTLLLGSLTAAAVRIVALERDELENVSEWSSLSALAERPFATRISARLSEVTLHAGEHALFEVCAKDRFDAARWRDRLDFMVWQPALQKLALRVSLDAAHLALVKRRPDRACLTLGGGTIAEGGRYALEAVWKQPLDPDLARIPVRARILARTPLGARDGLLIVAAGVGAMLSVLSAFAPEGRPAERRRASVPWAVAGTLVAALLAAVLLHLPLSGAIGGLCRGLSLACIEILVAVGAAWLIYGSLRPGLALHAPPTRASLWLLSAVLCAGLLNPLARLTMRMIPASGEAPIEAFIAWPSGALAFAALGMAVPLAEELFFRGFVFGALTPLGTGRAVLGSVCLFGAIHAQQAWGQWGALLAVTMTGIVLTGLRAVTGSTLVPAVAHLLYNLSLWRDSFGG